MHLQVFITCGSKSEAGELARLMVAEKLCACVQVAGPVSSIYRWRGAVETAEEWLCIAKTLESVYPSLEKRVLAEHSYENPEIIACPVSRGSAKYLDWIDEQVPEA